MRRVGLLGLLLVGLLLVPAGAGAQSSNLLTNPGFESDFSGWWVVSYTAANIQTTQIHAGAKAGKCTVDTTYQGGKCQVQTLNGVGLAGATTYVFSAWLYVPVATGAGNLRLATSTNATQDCSSVGTNAWVQCTLTFTTGQNGGNTWVELDVGYAGTFNGTVYFDDFSLAQYVAPTATPTNTPIPPTATSTPVPPTATPTGAGAAMLSNNDCRSYVIPADSQDNPVEMQIGVTASDNAWLMSGQNYPQGVYIQNRTSLTWDPIGAEPYGNLISDFVPAGSATGGLTWPFKTNGQEGLLYVCFGGSGGGGDFWPTATPTRTAIPPTPTNTATTPASSPTATPTDEPTGTAAPTFTPYPTLEPPAGCQISYHSWGTSWTISIGGVDWTIKDATPAGAGGSMGLYGWINIHKTDGTDEQINRFVSTDLSSYGFTAGGDISFNAPSYIDGWATQPVMMVCQPDAATPTGTAGGTAAPTSTSAPTLTPTLANTPTPPAPNAPTAWACACTPVPAPTGIIAAMPDLAITLAGLPVAGPTVTVTIGVSITGALNGIATMQASLQTPVAAVVSATGRYSWSAGQAEAQSWGSAMQPGFAWLAILNPANSAWSAAGGPLWAVAPFVVPLLPIVLVALLVVFAGFLLWLLGWLLKLVDLLASLLGLIPFL